MLLYVFWLNIFILENSSRLFSLPTSNAAPVNERRGGGTGLFCLCLYILTADGYLVVGALDNLYGELDCYLYKNILESSFYILGHRGRFCISLDLLL